MFIEILITENRRISCTKAAGGTLAMTVASVGM